MSDFEASKIAKPATVQEATHRILKEDLESEVKLLTEFLLLQSMLRIYCRKINPRSPDARETTELLERVARLITKSDEAIRVLSQRIQST